MTEMFLAGQIDWLSESVFPALRLLECNAEILARRWKNGVAEYRPLLITRTVGGMSELSQLVGKTIALEDPGSSSGYFAPLALLADAGFGFVQVANFDERAPQDKIAYVFAGSEINVATWVERGFVAAGALDSISWNDPSRTLSAIRPNLRILTEGPPLPRAAELVRANADALFKRRLLSILLAAHLDPDARAPLLEFQETQKFDGFDGQALESLLYAQRIWSAHRSLLL